MKNKILLIGFFFIVLSSFVFGYSGTGSVTDPYILSSCTDLNNSNSLNTYGYFELNKSLNCENFKFENIIINMFNGHFTGNNYTIKNIHLDDNTQWGISFIRTLNGTLTDIKFENLNLNGRDNMGIIGQVYPKVAKLNNIISINQTITSNYANTGGLIGKVFGGIDINISNIYITGNIQNDWYYIGGLIGLLYSPLNMNNVAFKGNLSKASSNNINYIGGLVGYSTAVLNINNSYFSGNLKYSGTYIGGLVGQVSSLLDISNSFVYANMLSTTNSIYGTVDGYISNQIYYYNNSNVSQNNQATALNKTEFSNMSFFKANNWDFNYTWNDSSLYPILQIQNLTFKNISNISYTPISNVYFTVPTSHEIVHNNLTSEWKLNNSDNISYSGYLDIRDYATSYYIDNISVTGTNVTIDTTQYADGSDIWLILFLTDETGHTISNSSVFEIDNTAPSISVDVDNYSNGTITGLCNDINGISSLWYNDTRFNAQLYSNGSFILSSSIASGKIYINMSCNDTINNRAYFTFNFTIDNAKPVCSGISDTYDIISYNNTIVLNGYCTDNYKLNSMSLFCPAINKSAGYFNINASNKSITMILNNIGIDFICYLTATDELYNTTISAAYYMYRNDKEIVGIGSCPSSTPGVLILFLMFGLVGSLIVFGLFFDSIFATLGAIGLLIVSITLAHCSFVFGSVMIIISVVILVYSFFI